MDHLQEMIYWGSNGHMADNVTLPQEVMTIQ